MNHEIVQQNIYTLSNAVAILAEALSRHPEHLTTKAVYGAALNALNAELKKLTGEVFVSQVQVTDGMPRVGLGPHVGDPPGSLRGGAVGGVGRLSGLMTCGCVGSCRGHTTYGDYIGPVAAALNEGDGVTGD